MIGFKRHIASILLTLFIIVFMGGCSQEEFAFPKGTLRLCIGHTSKKADTRTAPLQLGKPLAEKFNLRVKRSEGQRVFYEGTFVDNLELNVGNYDITAYYGENVTIGKDTPYYEGMVTATIVENQATSVTIPCRVANALVSIIFGDNEENTRRFNKYYSDYGVSVRIGDNALSITRKDPESSIYFPAGSSPKLYFFGTLKEEGQFVSYELTSETLPTSFKAADHAIVTLSLPDPESALNVNISKVDMETVLLDETIPMSWLPIPTATAQHHYNDNSELVGTDIVFSNSYPGMQWKAVVMNEAGEEVRSVSGSGELLSVYDSSLEWTYLPSGDYKATFYLEDGGNYNKVGSRDFTVGKPELKISVGGYSSYTKYLEGDVDAANACDRKTIYSPSVKLNVSEGLLAKYGYSFTYTYAGATEQVPAGKNGYTVEAITNQAVSLTPYRLVANASFDGASASNYKDFYITGLPVTYTPPKEATGWKGSGTVSFLDSEVRLGLNTVTEGQSITNQDFAIPKSTKISFGYNVMVNTMWVGTVLTITLGDDELLRKDVGAGISIEEHPYTGTEVKTLTAAATKFECYNTYGAGQTYSCIRSLSLNYGK